jgi:hypothetical protein
MIRPYLHLLLHLLVPAAVAGLFFRQQFFKAWAIMCATMLVDLDHLLSDPVYDPGRCSIGTHPLHEMVAIGAYSIALLWPKIRLVAIGLIIHMALDGIDCVWMA